MKNLQRMVSHGLCLAALALSMPSSAAADDWMGWHYCAAAYVNEHEIIFSPVFSTRYGSERYDSIRGDWQRLLMNTVNPNGYSWRYVSGSPRCHAYNSQREAQRALEDERGYYRNRGWTVYSANYYGPR